MYKIIIHIPTHTDNTWFYYQEDGKDYVANTLQEIRETVLTLIDVYGEDYIKIVKQETGDDMFGSVEGFLYDDSDDYEELLNRPFINGIEVIGQLSLEQLGIQPAGDYALHDDLNRVEDKIDNIDLTPYALNSRVDSVESKIDNIDLTPYATNTRVDGVESKVDAIDLTPYATMEYLDEVVAGIDFSSTNEEISGIKTFSVLPRSTVTPISEEELTNKAYVDHEVLGCATEEYVDNKVSNFYSKTDIDNMMATKKYVDDAIANIDIPEVDVDLTNYYNKEEVDQAIANVQLSGEVMAEMAVYPIDEQVIGTWMDGRPLYRKVYNTFTLREGAKMDDIMLETDNNKNVKNSYGILRLTDGPDFYTAGIGSSDGGFGIITYVQKNTSGLLYINRTHGAYCSIIGLEIVVEYTKTSDEPNSSTLKYYPITKEYVDEAIAASITSVLGGEY